MRLAVSTYSLHRWRSEDRKTLEQSLEWIAAHGLRRAQSSRVAGVEFAGPIAESGHDLSRRAAALRSRCEQLGLTICSYCVSAELLVPPAQQKKVVERLKCEVDAAAELGAPTMRHDVTRGTGATSFAATLKAVGPPVRGGADYHGPRGVT